jgi:hypothetical protein
MTKIEFVKRIRTIVRDSGGFIELREAAEVAAEIWEEFHPLPEECPACGSRTFDLCLECDEIVDRCTFKIG